MYCRRDEVECTVRGYRARQLQGKLTDTDMDVNTERQRDGVDSFPVTLRCAPRGLTAAPTA